MVTEIYVLVMMLYSTNGIAVNNVPGFATEQSCEREGKRGEAIVKDTARHYRYVCLRQEFKTDLEHSDE